MAQPKKNGAHRGSGMSRRELLHAGVAGSLAVAAGRVVPAAVRGPAEAAPVQGVPFELEEATIAQLQAEMNAGTHTARSLTEAYLGRIAAIDPSLRSVIEVNPDAVAIAVALDAERKAKGPRGPLHGIPVVVKDNIATADRMATTAGSLALVGAKAPRDSFVAERLRAAGAVILGKTNLSEWANFRSSRS
ncbi:MAG: amidase, partial [Acidobacteria bacterium 37-65-4]